uniref:Regulatory protein zeste n=1 Tax=Acrobeloides nanus TaxID=290746 RepID=A0A914DXP8_9BILA
MVFTKTMTTRLAELVRDNHNSLFPKSREKSAVARQTNAWQLVTDTLNKENPDNTHTVTQIQTKWKNLKSESKTQTVAGKKHANGTGGGPPMSQPDGAVAVVQAIYSNSHSFNGIPNAIETPMDYQHLYEEEELNSSFLSKGTNQPPKTLVGSSVSFVKQNSFESYEEIEENMKASSFQKNEPLSNRHRRRSMADLQREVLEKELENAKCQTTLYDKLEGVLEKFDQVLSKSNEFLDKLNK